MSEASPSLANRQITLYDRSIPLPSDELPTAALDIAMAEMPAAGATAISDHTLGLIASALANEAEE